MDELPRVNQYRTRSPYDAPTHGHSLRGNALALQNFVFSRVPEGYFTETLRQHKRSEMDGAYQRFKNSPLWVTSQAENVRLIMACCHGQIDLVKSCVPTQVSAIRGGEQRLQRKHINCWKYRAIAGSDDTWISYDPGGFWLDNPDKRLYGRNRETGFGPLCWDQCFSLDLPPRLRGHTPLTAASKYGHTDIVDHLLYITPCIPGIQDVQVPSVHAGTGDTPCHLAARGGHWETLRRILQYSSPASRAWLYKNPQFKPNINMLTPFSIAYNNVHSSSFVRSSKICMILLACHGDKGTIRVLCTDLPDEDPFYALILRCWEERHSPNIVSYWNELELRRLSKEFVEPIVNTISVNSIPPEVSRIIGTFLFAPMQPIQDLNAVVPIRVIDALFESMMKSIL
jgi:hypothetical protein